MACSLSRRQSRFQIGQKHQSGRGIFIPGTAIPDRPSLEGPPSYILWPDRISLVASQQHAYSRIGDIGTDSDPCSPLPHHTSPLYGPQTHSPSQLPVSDLPVYRHSNGRFPVTPRQLRHTLGTERADKLDVLVLQEGSK